MKVTTHTVFDILSRLRNNFLGDDAIRKYDDEPFRSELYSSGQIERHGRVVAQSHTLAKVQHIDKLLKRLESNEKKLLEVRHLLVENIRSGKSITPGAEWLLDNFYLVEEQVVLARKHLPKGYSEALPYLANGISTGMPRVYDIVLEIISHSDGRVDVSSLSSFISSYQTHSILTLGELWAIPIMLRLAVIENLRRLAGKIALDMIDHNLADYWTDRMIAVVKNEPSDLILVVADMARSKPALDSHFVACFTRKLQGKGTSLALPLNWMEQQLSGNGTSISDLILQENQKQAVDQVSVRNSIGTLRFIGATDWREFVENLSTVEQMLRQDPTGTYPLMDFATRDSYRHVVESIAKYSPLSETEVAEKALELSRATEGNEQKNAREKHVGYFLIDNGVEQTEKATGMHYTLKQKLRRTAGRHAVTIYLGSIICLSAMGALALFWIVNTYSYYDWKIIFAVSLICFFGCLHLAVSFVNWISTILVQPGLLPRMDYSKGIPNEFRSLVIIPTMLTGREYIEELIEGLEIRYLANREARLHFGLLTDFMDADAATMPGDESLIAFAKEKIDDLNEKYRGPETDTFFLFHRPRTWNNRERKWMGYERKRGKLSALNALLRGHGHDQFSEIAGNLKILSEVKYVITLDSDTLLPRESVWKFVSTMAHPLNRPVYDFKKRRVIQGYGILQPRVEPSIPSTSTTLYLRLQGSVSGIDPYTQVSSDVYQDLFGEGSYIGKGVYDVDMFEQALNGVFPENSVLSHDLLEGCYARSGLISDVHLYEESPAEYRNDVKRHHRWIRGDWQAAAWMLPIIKQANGSLKTNKLSALSRWKIFDNLRRSLLPITLTLMLLLGWFLLPFPWLWTSAVTIIILLPLMTAAFWQLIHKPADITLESHFFEVAVSVRDVLLRFMFGLAVLPYEALKYTDAAIRTIWRMFITHRHLLEWMPSAATIRPTNNNIWSIHRSMWIAPFTAIACTVLLLYTNAVSLYVASPILMLWLLSPAIAWGLSKVETEEKTELTERQTIFLLKRARKTWSYFEQFINEEENWLPPDNFQEQPVPIIAHRTSPTNIGLSLLANLSAYDFSYISGGEFVRRCNNTFQTMLKLERYKDHFYNWYDTISLLPLRPRYISTVDSGNLAGHLLTLRQAFLSQNEQPVFKRNIYSGCITTARIIRDLCKGNNAQAVEKILQSIQLASEENSFSLSRIKKHLDELDAMVNEFLSYQQKDDDEIITWTSRLSHQIKNFLDEFTYLVPWVELLPVPEQFSKLGQSDQVPSLTSISELSVFYIQLIQEYELQETNEEDKNWLMKMRASILNGSNNATERMKLLAHLARVCEELSSVEYDFLFNKSTSLLRIGYNVDEQRHDNSYYDLLASESRLGIFVGIAQGKLPQESWFALGRLLTNSGGDPILLSWSGSMFEYLMPQLVMPSYENTLLYQTNKATVKRQIEYGTQRGIPWGISESGYNMVDANLTYQYKAFGVPGLGLKRGLEEDIVIAPYATMLALMVAPRKACANLQLLTEEGFEGRYGYFEAVDYTSSRLSRGKTSSIVYSYMVHHQGMSLLSLAYVLLNKPMQQRFVSELRFQATLLLLQERIPRTSLFYAHTADLIETPSREVDIKVRTIHTPNTRYPEIQLLSNGRYHVMISNSGGGYSSWKDLAITRWREDVTKDDHGIFCFIKDMGTGRFWSNTYQPALHTPKNFEVIFSQGHVEFRRQDFGIEARTEIIISPEDDIELRRIRITNKTQIEKVLETTSYTEIVMASQASDESHPAFSNLFVQTEIIRDHNAIYCTRRPRSEQEVPPWTFHMMHLANAEAEDVSYETDRMRFTGRGRNLTNPLAMEEEVLSDTQGAVLDPIMSIRYRFTLQPGQSATIDLIFGISETKEACGALMRKYGDKYLKRRAIELSWTHSQVLLRQINATEADAQLFNRLAGSIIYSNSNLRADKAVIQNNFRGQSGLWSHSVSGDFPIVLLHIYDAENLDIVRQMMQAHAYWRLKGLAVDLVIWNEDHGSYRQLLQEKILGMVSTEANNLQAQNKPGNIFVKSADQLSSEDRILFESVARIIIYDNRGSLLEQITKINTEKALPLPLPESGSSSVDENKYTISLADDLLFFNGTGGFTKEGNEYKIIISKNKTTPAPWVNVIANPVFGSVVSESGSAYTWAVNAHEYRLTPWSNDPVSDIGGEAFYLRDEESGNSWSPSPFPKKGLSPYIVTHGFGYSIFEHMEEGIHSEMTVFVDKELPVKFYVITIKNVSERERKLSATGFLEIILGDVRSKTNMHILSEYDSTTGAILFRNRYNPAFAERVGYLRVDGGLNLSYTADRSEFIGRNRHLGDPLALTRKKLSGNVGAALDPCAALHVKFNLLQGAENKIIFQVGNEANTAEVNSLIERFRDADNVMKSLQVAKEYWKEIIHAVQITTPDDSVNLLANGWLVYQTMACRMFARSGFYQSGGAFGFRDQLQDVMALLYCRPELARHQILLSASRQFAEGDVQHWWHPPEGRGVRTRCSDDMLWLPYTVLKYISSSGDTGILSVSVGYLESRILFEGEDSLYDLPVSSSATGSLYDHCVRAIRHSLRYGEHGLPLIGSGDWNDGMDQVGNKGKGESVWLAFFLYDILVRFADVAGNNGDEAFAETCRKHAGALQMNIESSGWDGKWYRRAYFDDGTPLGAEENKECRIDAIAQSWSVLSHAAGRQRSTEAMYSLDTFLVNRNLKLIQLLDPPFDSKGLNPGYIRGYVPGVRENGGQYSHAAIWTLIAFAALRNRKKVWELFSMIQPLSHAYDEASIEIYKAEPYVMAADVYANELHRGRGGWTWYTGSAGWMYQFIIGSFIGMELHGDKLKFRPCFPLDWPSVNVKYRFGNSLYNITVYQENNSNESHWKTDAIEGAGDTLPLTDDGLEHHVEFYISAGEVIKNEKLIIEK